MLCLSSSEVSVMALLLLMPLTLTIELDVFGYISVKASRINQIFSLCSLSPPLPKVTLVLCDCGSYSVDALFHFGSFS